MADIYKQYLQYSRPPDFKFQFPAEKSFYWVMDKTKGTYEAMELIDGSDSECLVLFDPESGQEVIKGVDEAFPINPSKFDGVEDCAQLGHLSEASVLYNLKLRYDANVIYTYSGLFCVAINPYRFFPIYDPEIIKMYINKRRDELAPHVYSVADGAYRKLLNDKASQSMLVTGESGAGKTENTKKIIQYLAAVAGKSGDEGELERQLLQANPLLEALGNAKTLKNNNSSRFGKFIKITFSQNGFISGGSIISYLLEKSRVVQQGKMERTFHIFYQMCDGLPSAKKQDLFLTKPDDYYYLNQSGCTHVEGINDASEFEDTLKALKILNFSEVEITTIFRVCAGILNLGNVKFTGDEVAKISNPDFLLKTAELFGTKPEVLQNALIKPRITVGTSELIAKNLTPSKATQSRDALAKAIYGRMFLWVVDKINQTLKVKQEDKFIGILDIAGFEIFVHNSFEQLCINFTNERLQQFFNNYMFHQEQEEYKREKIEWSTVDFGIDSQATIDLISKQGRGLLALLDEECIMPNGTDKAYAQKVVKLYSSKHPKFSQSKLSAETTFSILHYAGGVNYDCTDWCEKNKDPLQNDLELAITGSSNPIVSKFFTEFATNAAAESVEGKDRTNTRKKGAAFVTVGAQYKEQLDSLLNTLGRTTPHFVRCIIPNHRKVAGEIDDLIVLDQLSCNGVLEGIKISRLGYPNRMPYKDFHKRYYMLGDNVPSTAPDSRSATVKIIDKLASTGIVDTTRLQYGATKIFFRVGQMVAVEEARERFISAIVPVIQACARGYIGRKIYTEKRERVAAAEKIQESVRLYIELQDWPWFRLFTKVRSSLNFYTTVMDIENTTAKIEEIDQQIQEVVKQKQLLFEDAEMLNDEIEFLKPKIKQQVDENEEMEEELKLVEEVKKKLRQNILETEDELNKKSREIQTLESSRDLLELEVIHVETTGGDFSMINEKLEKEISVTQEKLTSRKIELNQISENNQNVEQENSSLNTEKDEKTDQLERLIQNSKNLRRMRESLEDEIDDGNEEFERLTKGVNTLRLILDELEAEFSLQANNLRTVSEQREEENSETKLKEDELDALTAENEAESKKRSDLESQKSSLESQLDEVELDLDDEKKDIGILSKKLDTVMADFRDFQEDQESIREKNSQLTFLKLKLQSEVDALKRAVGETGASLLSLEKTKKMLEKNLDEQTDLLEQELYKIQNLEKNNQTLQQRIEALNQDISTEGGENSKLTKYCAKLDSAIQALNKQLSSFASVRIDVVALNKRLVSELEEARSERTLCVADKEKEETTARKLQKKCIQLEDSRNNMIEREKNKVETTSRMATELEQFNTQKAALLEKKGKLLAVTKNFESDFNNISGRLNDTLQSRALLEKQSKNLSSEVNELSDIEGQLDQQIKTLEKNIQKTTTQNVTTKETFEKTSSQLQKEQQKNEKFTQELKQVKLNVQNLDYQKEASEYQRERQSEQLVELRQNVTEMQKSLRSAEEGVRVTSQRVASLLEQLEQQQSLKKNVEKQLKELRFGLEGVKDRVDESKMKHLLQKKEKLQAEIKTTMSEIEKEQNEKKKCQAQLPKLKQTMEELNANFNLVSVKKRATEKEIQKMMAESQTNRARLKRQEDTLSVLEKDIKQTEKEVFKATQLALSRLDVADEITFLRSEMEEARHDYQIEQQEHLDYQKQIRQLTAQLERLQEANDRLVQENDQFYANGEREAKLLDQIKETRRQIKQKQDLQTILDNEIRNSLDFRITDLKSQLFDCTCKVDKVKEKRELLELDLFDTKRAIENEVKKRVELQHQLRELKFLLKKISEPLPDLEEAQKDLKEKVKLIKKTRDRWVELDKEMDEQRELVVELRDLYYSLRNELGSLKHSNQTLAQSLETLSDEVEDSKQLKESSCFSLNTSERILNDLMQELSEVKAQVKKEMALGDELEGINIELDLDSDRINEMKQKEQNRIKTLEALKKELEEERGNLCKFIQQEKEETEELLNEKAKCRTELIAAREEEEGAKEMLMKLDEILWEKGSKQKKVSVSLEPLEKTKKPKGIPRQLKLEAKVKKYQNFLLQQEQTTASLQAQQKSKKNEMLNLREYVADLRDELTLIRKRNAQMRDPRRRFADRLGERHMRIQKLIKT